MFTLDTTYAVGMYSSTILPFLRAPSELRKDRYKEELLVFVTNVVDYVAIYGEQDNLN